MNLRVSLAQINVLVGDVDGNLRRVVEATHVARTREQAHVVVFPELTLTGYPPEDLLLRPELDERVARALDELCRAARGIDVIVGYPRIRDGKRFNAAGVVRDGRIIAEYYKALLPNYSVFDEKRYFEPGGEPCVFEIQGVRVGITICEDIWFPLPAARAKAAGAQLLINLNASPFHKGKAPEREELIGKRARENGIPIVYVNLVGGQDELVFDGGSFVVDAAGELSHRLAYFEEAQAVAEFTGAGQVATVPGTVAPALPAGGGRLLCPRSRRPRLRCQEWLPWRSPRSVGRHRLGARAVHRGRRARPRRRSRCSPCLRDTRRR